MLSVDKGLHKTVCEVVGEINNALPPTARMVDYRLDLPDTQLFIMERSHVIKLACQARREGAENRADAIEMAFDSLIARTRYTRVGEVYPDTVPNGLNGPVKVFAALTVERT